MRRAGRQASVILFALVGLSMAHAGTYLLTFRCWSCHEDLTSAAQAALAGSSACVLAVVALIVTLIARGTARASSARISISRLVVAEVVAFVLLGLLEQRSSLSHPFAGPTVILELGLLLVTGVLLARFARVVELVVRVIRASGSFGRRGGDARSPRRPAGLSSAPRATTYNATGFLRAPPLPA